MTIRPAFRAGPTIAAALALVALPAQARVIVQVRTVEGSAVTSKVIVYRGGSTRPEPTLTTNANGDAIIPLACDDNQPFKITIEPQPHVRYSWNTQPRSCESTIMFRVRRNAMLGS